MRYNNNIHTMDEDLANGIGLHMILIWGRVALVQGVPLVFKYNSILTIICTAILSLYYLYVFAIKHRYFPKVNQGSIFVAIIVIITVLFTIVAWPNNIQYMDPIGNTFFYEIIPFAILSMLKTIDSIYIPMVRASKYLMFLCLVSSISILANGHTTVSSWMTYSMPLSYATLYATIWLMNDYTRNKEKLALVLSIIGVFILLFFGSRNTLLSVATFILITIFSNRKKNTLLKTFLLIVLVLTLVFWKEILGAINSFSSSLGVTSRTIRLFLNQDYFADNRNGIHYDIYQVLNNHPLGVGIAGDVAQTKEFAHGLYVSILCTYGYLIGALAIIAIMLILLKAYLKSRDFNKDILMIYMILVLPRGFTGGDVWSSDVFWWMIAIALSVISHRISFDSNEIKTTTNGIISEEY